MAGHSTTPQVLLEGEGDSKRSGVEPQALTELVEAAEPAIPTEAEGHEPRVSEVGGGGIHLQGSEELKVEDRKRRAQQ